MKKHFHISKVGASGMGKTTSAVTLMPGLNIIYGPSNTGKSYVIECIDYIFGLKGNPFLPEETGYDTIFMEVTSDSGCSITLSRKLNTKKINVSSNSPDVDRGEYSVKEISNLFLKLIGIENAPKVIKSQDFRTQNLTWRTILHTFLIKEGDIFKRESIFTNSGFNNKTAVLSSILYYLTGKSSTDENQGESKEIREAKKAAVIQYINTVVTALSERKGELTDQLLALSAEDIEIKITALFDTMASIEAQISSVTAEIQTKSKTILSLDEQLQEDSFLLDRYQALETQYCADIKRAEFIVDGEAHARGKKRVDKCPFCAGDIPEQKHRSYKKAAEQEIVFLHQQLDDLLQAKSDLEKEIETTTIRRNELSSEIQALSKKLSDVLQPEFGKLKNLLAQYQKALDIKNEIHFIEETAGALNSDAQDVEKDTENPKYDAEEHFDKSFFADITEKLDEALRLSNYPDYLSARLAAKKFDIVVNGQEKASEGKGFRAFLNTVLAFSLMKYLSEKAVYAPNMLVLDSPILSLSEKSGDEGTNDSMKAGLFRYIKTHCGTAQVIIAENNIPDIDYTGVNLVPFSKNKVTGRYGFLADMTASMAEDEKND